jgi:hypothetical protein
VSIAGKPSAEILKLHKINLLLTLLAEREFIL